MARKPEPDWQAIQSEVYEAFSPGAPIKLEAELAGREEQALRLRNIVLSAGEHALIYGERGVGKTSIALTFWLGLNSKVRSVRHIHVDCGNNDFSEIWRKIFRRIRIIEGGERTTLDKLYEKGITPDDVELELANFGLNELPIILLDEFDRVKDKKTKAQMAELIKSLSDHAAHTKVVLIGIASSAGELISEHASISRALKQVKMPRLSLSELEKIVVSRYARCGISARDDSLFQIAFLSRGLPYYAHLLGRHAALAALGHKRLMVREEDVFEGLQQALQEVDQTITEAYLSSVRSQRPDDTLFEPVLIACALAEADDLGQFQQAAVTAPLAEIATRQPPYTPTTFAFHMNEFCGEKRGKALEKVGEARNFRYFFTDPMMQPYVIIRALENGKLPRETFEKFITRRQRSLSI